MSAIPQGIKAMTLDQHPKISPEFKEARKSLVERRENWLDNPSYLTGIQYSFALATYKAALKTLTDLLGIGIEKDVLEMISYENHMCEQYWGELVDGPMLVSKRKPRNS